MGEQYIHTDATFSDCGYYRYDLYRQWTDVSRPTCCFVLLNPSTADAETDDPTVRRCMKFAQRWGYGSAWVVNLFAYRATDPKMLRQGTDHPRSEPGDANRNVREIISKCRASDRVVLAWGTYGSTLGAGRVMADKIRNEVAPQHKLMCFGTTKDGHPKHPLYLPADQSLRPFDFKSYIGDD
jgi:hypothetical protein